jgi:enoyl-CoA hydratase
MHHRAVQNQSSTPSLNVSKGIASLALNRPAHHNRLEREDLTVLEQQLQAVALDDAVKVLMLTARGNSFCAGFDLRALTRGEALHDPQQLERVINLLAALPQPTLAVLQGDVHGGGIDLTLACDFRLGVQGMQAHMPAAKLGVHYYAHGMRRYVQRMGANAARRLLVAGESFDSAALLRCGFLDQALPPDQLGEAALAYAQRVCASPAAVMQGMKRDIQAIEQQQFDETKINASWQQSLHNIAKHKAEHTKENA